jgi:hypothetical protein
MTMKPLSPQELRVWHAFRLMHEDVLGRVGRDIAQATGLSGLNLVYCLASLALAKVRCGNKRWPA